MVRSWWNDSPVNISIIWETQKYRPTFIAAWFKVALFVGHLCLQWESDNTRIEVVSANQNVARNITSGDLKNN